MKCQTMKIADVLFFIANLMTIYSTNVRQNIVSSPQSTTAEDEGVSKRNLDKDCPQLWKIIHDNNLTDYTVDCKTLNMKTDVVNEEIVLQQACFIVKNILYFMCDNVTHDLFKVDKNISVCPFNFSHISHLDLKLNDKELIVKELTLKEHCSKVCDDLYNTKTQCALLSRLNNYLKSQPLTQRVTNQDKSEHLHGTFTIQQNDTNHVSKKEEKEQQTEKSKTKEIMSKARNETSLDKLDETSKSIIKPIREQKTEKITSTQKEEQMPKTEIKMPENENFAQADDDFKQAEDDQNEDLTNDDGVGLAADSFSDRSETGKVDKISASPPKGKEIYPAEGFFQAEDSHFFFYFIMVSSVIVIGYLAFHNKNKILAYALEGTSSRRTRRRPNPARYRKLETNLEEAISSNATNSAASNVVY